MLDKIEKVEPTDLYKKVSPDLLFLVDEDNKLIDFYNNLLWDNEMKK